ncbi:MAG TPA: tricarballylate utilization 4Fe-4S protein TcuB [Chloroflexota bacterium]
MLPVNDPIKEAERQMIICNACRYCEGFCAVFQAMELRRHFSRGDITYLANLCFDCRACYYACQYAPPHEFDINVPKTFAQVRAETYQRYSWPHILARLIGGRVGTGVLTGVCVALVLGLVLLLQGPEVVFGVHLGEGAFFRVVPYMAMTAPALAITAYGLAVFAVGAIRFWRDTGGSLRELLDRRAFLRAARDAMGLRYLKGGGDGCNYPDYRFSHARRIFHHLTFYGFLLDLASTTLAAIYHNIFHWEAPYPLTSPVVILGTVGGIMIMIGTVGLLRLKWRSDREPAEEQMTDLDEPFIVILFLTAATGMVVLALRETAAMGVALAVHLGVVAAFFFTAPYGKFAHVVYRYAALVRHAIEQRRHPVHH